MANHTILLLLLSIVIFSCMDKETIERNLITEQDSTNIHFKHARFTKILDEAEQQKKPILIYVTSDGCGPCIRMEREVFSDTTVQKFYNNSFVCGKIYIRRTGSVMKTSDYKELNRHKLKFLDLHDIQEAFPTFMVLDHNGQLIDKRTGFMDVNSFLTFGKSSSE